MRAIAFLCRSWLAGFEEGKKEEYVPFLRRPDARSAVVAVGVMVGLSTEAMDIVSMVQLC